MCATKVIFVSVFTVERHFLVTEIRNFYAVCNSHFLFHSFTQEMSALVLLVDKNIYMYDIFCISCSVYMSEKKPRGFLLRCFRRFIV